jgi:hypothetical protein
LSGAYEVIISPLKGDDPFCRIISQVLDEIQAFRGGLVVVKFSDADLTAEIQTLARQAQRSIFEGRPVSKECSREFLRI